MSIEILPDAEALALRAADLFALAAQEAAAARGRFAAALSGGETPRALYRMLARQQFSQKIPWRRVQLYWGDERCVPPDDSASNFGMARVAFLKHVPLPEANVHRVHGEEEPGAAALSYEKELRALAALERPKSELPVFDLVLLGLGGDGHTASLFPHGDALTVAERFAVATEAPDGSPRVACGSWSAASTRPGWWPKSSTACACPRRCRRRACGRCTGSSRGCSTKRRRRS